MSKRTPPTYPSGQRQILALGERLRAARLRRGLSQAMIAERVGITVATLGKLESGNPSTSLATMLRVLQALGFAGDIDRLAADDVQGRMLQDNQLTRAPARPRQT